MLKYNSLYFKVSKENMNNKKELIHGVMGAIIMYIICFLISLYIIWKGNSKVIVTSLSEPRLKD